MAGRVFPPIPIMIGTPNFLDSDDDGDGIPTTVEDYKDFDGDGRKDYVDDDIDNDSIKDNTEGTRDSDGDGRPDNVTTQARHPSSDLDNQSLVHARRRAGTFCFFEKKAECPL